MSEKETKQDHIPFMPHPVEPDPAMPVESPDQIVRDLLKTEKDIATETMRVLRAKHERERGQWETIYAGKEREILTLKGRMQEAEERLKQIQERFEEERSYRLEQISASAREIESRRALDDKKWQAVADEVHTFRTAAAQAAQKMRDEQLKVDSLKRNFAKQEKLLKEYAANLEDEIARLKEAVVAKEESGLKTEARLKDDMHALQEQLTALQQTVTDERQYQGKLVEKKDVDLGSLQKALQDTVVQLNFERAAKESLGAELADAGKKIQSLEEKMISAQQEREGERTSWMKTVQEEQSSWEKYKLEYAQREDALRKETEDQVQRILRSVEIIEQQLSDERKQRADIEEKLRQKNEEVAGILRQKDDMIAEWKRILAGERDAWQSRQNEIVSEFEKIRQKKDDELSALRQELQTLQAGIAEEKMLIGVQREESRQVQQKLIFVEEGKHRIAEQLNNREKEWKAALDFEQEMYQKQLEELKSKTDAQLSARDKEIERMNEDLAMLNGQVLELRQSLSLEKNENISRIGRIQDLENQLRNLTGKYNLERTDWLKKLQSMQEQWESQRKNLTSYQSEIEGQFKRDIGAYQERIRELTVRLGELQTAPPSPTIDEPSSLQPRPAAARTPAPHTPQTTPTSTQPAAAPHGRVYRYYPGK